MVILFAALLFAAGCGSSTDETLRPSDLQASAAPAVPVEKVLLLEHAPGENSYVGGYAKMLKAELEARDVGIRVEIFPGASLVGHTERADRMLKENELQMKISGGPYGILIRPLCYPSVSGLTLEEFSKVLEDAELRAWLDQKCAEAGLRYLGSLPSQELDVSARSPIRTTDELVGVRVRIEESSAREEFWRATGAQPVFFPLQDAPSAREKNLFDANVNNTLLDTAAYGLFWEDGYLIRTAHEYYTYPLYVSELFWEGLSDRQQAALQDAVNTVCAKATDDLGRLKEEALEKMTTAGCKVMTLAPGERERLLSLTHDAVYEKLCHIFGEEQVEFMLSFVDS